MCHLSARARIVARVRIVRSESSVSLGFCMARANNCCMRPSLALVVSSTTALGSEVLDFFGGVRAGFENVVFRASRGAPGACISSNSAKCSSSSTSKSGSSSTCVAASAGSARLSPMRHGGVISMLGLLKHGCPEAGQHPGSTCVR